jgi:6-phosphogluconolactonase/glucosamine-6-phosphate isomerase/deaminase
VSDVDLFVVDDEEAAAATAAERLVAAARHGLSIVVTGGTTPKLAYERAALLEPDWSGAMLWWSDERCVPRGGERDCLRKSRGTRTHEAVHGFV